MDPPSILLTSNCPHPLLISPDFATMDSSISIPEQPIPSIVPHQVNCGIDCLWLASSSTVAPLQSTVEDNLNCTTDFACMDGGNLVKMISVKTQPRRRMITSPIT